MITWLASYPRSGNTLYRMFLYHLWDIPTYSIYNDRDITKMGAGDTVGHRQMTQPLGHYRKSDEMFYVKTHNLPSDHAPAVYIVRDVRDVMVSYAHYRQDMERCLDDFDTILRRLITGDRWGGWSEHITRWTDRSQTLLTVKYEDLVERPEAVFPEAKGKVPDFDHLHDKWPQFFRKGKTGGWKGEMKPSIERLCWEHHGEVMEKLGYER